MCFRGISQIGWNVPKSKSIAHYQVLLLDNDFMQVFSKHNGTKEYKDYLLKQ